MHYAYITALLRMWPSSLGGLLLPAANMNQINKTERYSMWSDPYSTSIQVPEVYIHLAPEKAYYKAPKRYIKTASNWRNLKALKKVTPASGQHCFPKFQYVSRQTQTITNNIMRVQYTHTGHLGHSEGGIQTADQSIFKSGENIPQLLVKSDNTLPTSIHLPPF